MTSSRTVSPSVATALAGEKRAKAMVRMAAIRMAVPVAASQLKVYTAPYGVACATTGGILATSLSSMGTGMLMMVEASGPPAANSALKGLRLHSVTIAVRMMKGDQALRMAPAVRGAVLAATGLAADVAVLSLVSKRKMRLGCHTLRNPVSAISETMAEVMSGSSGPM